MRAATAGLSYRDLALLRAVAAGRCEVYRQGGAVLLIDGRCCCDQLAIHRLIDAELVVPPGTAHAPAELTLGGQATLAAAAAG